MYLHNYVIRHMPTNRYIHQSLRPHIHSSIYLSIDRSVDLYTHMLHNPMHVAEPRQNTAVDVPSTSPRAAQPDTPTGNRSKYHDDSQAVEDLARQLDEALGRVRGDAHRALPPSPASQMSAGPHGDLPMRASHGRRRTAPERRSSGAKVRGSRGARAASMSIPGQRSSRCLSAENLSDTLWAGFSILSHGLT